MAPYFINEQLVPLATKPETLVVYPHAQRTGGVTLRKRVLAVVFGEQKVYNRHYTENAKKWRNLRDADLNGYRAFTDLCDYRDIGLKRPVAFIASLRHPLYRAASIYFWVKKKDGHRHQQQALTLGLEDFYRVASGEHPEYFRNVQCMRVCGEPDAGKALQTIREKYIGAGFTNQLAEFVSALCEVFSWPPIALEGKGDDSDRYDASITPGFRDIVLEENAEDLKLFEAMGAVAASPTHAFPAPPAPPHPSTYRKPRGMLGPILDRFR